MYGFSDCRSSLIERSTQTEIENLLQPAILIPHSVLNRYPNRPQ